MNKLCVYLPPFAPDYSGACSALFDLNVLIIIHDASGCTGNYTGFDEPRWYGSSTALFCSGLREMDVIMGNEDALVKRIATVAKDLSPQLVAIVGSPVPMVMGTDFDGLACDVSEASGLPTFGFSTTGMAYYPDGVFAVAKTLLDHYCPDKMETRKGSANILGATPLDICQSELDEMKKILVQSGYIINACFGMEMTIEKLKIIPQAEINIAVTESGLRIAKYCKEHYGTPYIAGRPYGERGGKRFIERLRKGGREQPLEMDKNTKGEVLVIGDSVSNFAIAEALKEDFEIEDCVCATIFNESGLALHDEEEIIRELNKPQYSMVIADPFICDLVEKDTVKLVKIPHFAVSSKLFEPIEGGLINKNFNEIFKERMK